jgi:hypothetical protein
VKHELGLTMNKQEIETMLTEEFSKQETFDNWHGITRTNIKSFLVEPYRVTVISEVDGSDPREMWIVLSEYKDESAGYLIAYCPSEQEWRLVEKLNDGRYLSDVAGDKSLAVILDYM